jgi:hypothetical protein
MELAGLYPSKEALYAMSSEQCAELDAIALLPDDNS